MRLAAAVLIGELGAGFLGEEAQVDVAAVFGAVGADEVLGLVFVFSVELAAFSGCVYGITSRVRGESRAQYLSQASMVSWNG